MKRGCFSQPTPKLKFITVSKSNQKFKNLLYANNSPKPSHYASADSAAASRSHVVAAQWLCGMAARKVGSDRILASNKVPDPAARTREQTFLNRGQREFRRPYNTG